MHCLQMLVSVQSDSIRVADQKGLLPLHVACKFASADIVKYLLELNNGELNTCCSNNDSPLHHACQGGNCEVVIYLLKRQVVVSERDADGKLPIHLLHAAADKRWGIRDKATDLEAIWRLLLAYLNLCNMHVMPSTI